MENWHIYVNTQHSTDLVHQPPRNREGERGTLDKAGCGLCQPCGPLPHGVRGRGQSYPDKALWPETLLLHWSEGAREGSTCVQDQVPLRSCPLGKEVLIGVLGSVLTTYAFGTFGGKKHGSEKESETLPFIFKCRWVRTLLKAGGSHT